ncbi:histidine phosphatase family protein [Cereibacter sp. SYSU M97828]|nr:histidine phosphatase family protein [Cereibacter flavus]
MNELVLIRHAPALTDGLVTGRRDVGAELPSAASMAEAAIRVGPVARVYTSPALRCVQTAHALWPARIPVDDDALWEQDFGVWEGQPPTVMPDIGPQPRASLAALRPPGGESFGDLCARAWPALERIASNAGRSAILCHAGTVRAALALALEDEGAALAFEVETLSLTRLVRIKGAGWAVRCVNLPLT